MACCGQKRAQLVQNRQAVAVTNKIVAVQSPLLLFEYSGKTAMTVVGAGTGRSYRFRTTGDRVQIDIRDLRSVTCVPNLIRVRGA